ncbi:MAG TPA: S9 family peptidase [Candidatus Binatia bacterium]|nr:S9 family peptidase [Candidatus Binatia bacterium]
MRLLPLLAALAAIGTQAQTPDNLVTEGVPPITPELRADVGRYLEFRAASFQSWQPVRREMLITTRFGDTPQLHLVKMPGGARKQLTFLPEPVGGGAFQPKKGDYIVFGQDVGGGEFFQLYRYDLSDGKTTLLTDGKSRNTGARFSWSGKSLAYSSTKRNGKDTDIYVMDPLQPDKARLVFEVSTPGWQVTDWSHDDSRLLLIEYISINETYLHVLDIKTGKAELITPKTDDKIAYSDAKFAPDGKSFYVLSDKGSEFQRLVRFDPLTKLENVLTADIARDIDDMAISSNGELIAIVINEDGAGVLRVLDAKTGKERRSPNLPLGIVSGLHFHENNRDLAFNVSSARAPADVYSLDVKSGKVERWTESETGGLNADSFPEPEMFKVNSFDGTPISAFIYRPDTGKFPGRRPVIISIHGGPESQARPGFQARNNYYVNELGIAIIYPNVRGSAGYGKTFLTRDNGFKREDSVSDIGAIIKWVKQDQLLDFDRIAVMGGSYGGYMVLASMMHYPHVRCGIDVVGISNFLTFLKNTQDYRRDLRRVEYGDERDEKMREFLEKISPATNADKIKKPLFVVQGKNDPRVPLSESEQMVKNIRDRGGKVWYLMAKDEGHGFGKKKNADYQFLASILFLKENLLN